MSPEQENFNELRRLLALKRHEQPPPGYFQDFSRHVLARIQSEEAASSQSFWQRLFGPASWGRNLWDGFEAKPLVAGAFGVGICSLLVMGLISSERTDAVGLSIDNQAPSTVLATVPGQTIGTSLFERAVAEHVSTGNVYTAQNRSMFEEIQRPHVQNVSFSFPASGN